MVWQPTHHSAGDGSPAKLVRRLSETEVLMANENGDEWTDEAAKWAPIPQVDRYWSNDDRPEDDLPTFKILVVAKEYRTYTVVGNGEDDARVALLNAPEDFDYDRGNDVEDDLLEVIDIWEDR